MRKTALKSYADADDGSRSDPPQRMSIRLVQILPWLV
jgi:hypothetical protein